MGEGRCFILCVAQALDHALEGVSTSVIGGVAAPFVDHLHVWVEITGVVVCCIRVGLLYDGAEATTPLSSGKCSSDVASDAVFLSFIQGGGTEITTIYMCSWVFTGQQFSSFTRRLCGEWLHHVLPRSRGLNE